MSFQLLLLILQKSQKKKKKSGYPCIFEQDSWNISSVSPSLTGIIPFRISGEPQFCSFFSVKTSLLVCRVIFMTQPCITVESFSNMTMQFRQALRTRH